MNFGMIFSILGSLFFYLFSNSLHNFLSFILRHAVIDFGKNSIGNIFHSHKEFSIQTFTWKFFFETVRPESVCEIIMVYGTMFLNGIIAAVMVGKEKSLVGYDFGCTEVTKVYYSILKT